MDIKNIKFRYDTKESDIKIVLDILKSTGYFYDYEIEVAGELVEERLKSGVKSGYYFAFAEDESGTMLGYSCYGHIPCSVSSYDLYWIAVHKNFQRYGIGKIILLKTEELIKSLNGTQIYIETSNSEKYLSTRNFYLKCGYIQEAALKNFYGPGDDKVIYSKNII
ncbi:MAG TPA: GNAT family N-acetyltransferase [bacterium]|nr:GNAT family N-acetyltransferase [bacterium]HPN31977.1 GNAT family N-acetyltransferase [bacterium]